MEFKLRFRLCCELSQKTYMFIFQKMLRYVLNLRFVFVFHFRHSLKFKAALRE